MSGQSVRVQLEPGADILEAIAFAFEEAGVADGWLRAQGTARHLRLHVGDRPSLLADGVAEVVSLDAYVDDGEVVARAVASAVAAGVPVTQGGRVAAGEVVLIEAMVFGVGTVSAVHAATNAPAPEVVRKPSVAAEPPSASASSLAASSPAASAAAPSSSSAGAASTEKKSDEAKAKPSAWGRVAAVSERVRDDGDFDLDDDDDVEVEDLSKGDVLLHPSLGRCRVVSILNDDAIKVRLPNGRTRKLMMTVFVLAESGDAGVFQLKKRS